MLEQNALLLILVAVVIIFVCYVLLKKSSPGGGKISEGLYRHLAKKEPLWKKETILESVATTFDILKKSYDTKKSQVHADVMTVNIYRDLFKNVMPNLKRLAFVESATLKSMEIVQVRTHPIENRNGFTVRLDIEREQKEAQPQEGAAQEGSQKEEEKPPIYWTFIKVSNKWLLSEMTADPVPEGYFPGR